MRKFHNHVKAELLRRNLPKRHREVTVLDYGCGFGGDINKYIQCKVPCVLGVDPRAESVQEARVRFDNSGSNALYHFVHDENPLDFVRSLPDKCFNVVVIHFAIHYYCRQDQIAVIKEMARVLMPGGSLVVTCLDAKKVFQYNNSEYLHIKMLDPARIEVRLKDSVYFDSIGGASVEHLCFPHFLQQEGKSYFRRADIADFQSFYNGGFDLSEDQKRASFLHVAIVFRDPF